MNDAGSQESQSLWMTTAEMPAFPPLSGDATTDVCIVGAGIAGLTTAYLLLQAGKKVIVLDDGPIVSGETRRTTAHLANALDDRFYEMIKIHGKEGARLAGDSHAEAISVIERIVRDEHIDCNFKRLSGYLFLAPEHDEKELIKEFKATHDIGMRSVETLERADVTGFDSGPCLHFPAQGQFHPTKYLQGVAKAIAHKGGVIHAFSRVVTIDEGKQPFRVTTENGSVVSASHLVVATNAPINDNVAIYSKQAPYRTFVVSFSIPKGSVTHALYWDSGDPYHYVRVADDPDHSTREVLIVGGEDHRSGEENDAKSRYATLETWTRKHFPSAGAVRERWSGQVMETVDGLAMIGRRPGGHDESYIVTGDSGMGMTHGTIAGMLLTDLITGNENAWEKLYSPSRFRIKAGIEFLKDNMGTAKDIVQDYIGPGDMREQDVKPGHGAVVREGLKKIALYRDTDGTLFRRSAICPHKGCIVRWNDGEKSFDCPCHGSRFNAKGQVLNGPARTDLPALDS